MRLGNFSKAKKEKYIWAYKQKAMKNILDLPYIQIV